MLGAFRLRQPVSLACYFGNLLGLALTLMVFWLYARRSGALKPAHDPVARRRFVLVLLAHITASSAALIATAIEPTLTMNIYVAVLGLGAVIARRTK